MGSVSSCTACVHRRCTGRQPSSSSAHVIAHTRPAMRPAPPAAGQARAARTKPTSPTYSSVVDCAVAALSTTLSTAALDKHPQSRERGITLDLGFSAFTVRQSWTGRQERQERQERQGRRGLMYLQSAEGRRDSSRLHACCTQSLFGWQVPLPSELLASPSDDGQQHPSDDTHRLQFTLVDCPGHASLIRTIIGGAQIIDTMILVIDVTKGRCDRLLVLQEENQSYEGGGACGGGCKS